MVCDGRGKKMCTGRKKVGMGPWQKNVVIVNL